jgi:hypothetical protein
MAGAGSDNTKSKPPLPLRVLGAIGEIERPTTALLEDCADHGEVYGWFLDVPKVTEILRACARDSFEVRANYYELQPGFCRDWLAQVAEHLRRGVLTHHLNCIGRCH